MATTNQYLIFYIYLKDVAQVAALQGTLAPVDPTGAITGNGIGAILAAPDAAAITYSAPKLPLHSPVVAPGISSNWFGTDAQFPTNVASFDRKSGGWFGWSWLFGDTTHYFWRGVFVYVPGPDPVTGPTIQAVMPRRWVDGFEIPGGGEGGGGGALTYSREASRHAQGMGLAQRNSSVVRSHATNEFGGAAPQTSWERFYIRLRTAPAAATNLWRCKSNISPAEGACLQITAGRQITINGVDAVGTVRFIAAAPAIALDRWYRIDLLIKFDADTVGHTYGTVAVYQDGVQTLFVQITEMAGATKLHTSSEIGGTVGNTMAVDIDDWMNAAVPTNLTGIDWLSGSAMLLLTPTALDPASSVNWIGDVRNLQQLVARGATASMTSATAAANLLAITDAKQVISENPEALGIVAMVACLMEPTGIQAANTLGFVGADLTVGTLTGVAVSMGGVGSYNFLWKQGAGVVAIMPTQDIKIQFNHGNAGATTLKNMLAVVEVLGVFGTEDAPVGITPAPKGLPARLGVHNSPYPRTPWARLTTTPIQPVLLVTGTYVGNGTGQDLNFAVPVHFFRTRPLTGLVGGAMWFSSAIGARTNVEQQMECSHMSLARVDEAFVPGGLDTQQQQTKLSIAGNHAQSNAAGVTYAYVAICDPGMRFLLNCNVMNPKGTVDMVSALAHPRFTALMALIQFEGFSNGSTFGLYYKGPGHALQTITQFGGACADTTLALEFALGSVKNRSAFNAIGAGDDVALCLMRSSDGSLDDGVANAGKVLQIFTYTGNGSNTRTLNCTPPSGKRPMFAIIMPHGNNPQFRDPSHVGTASTTFTTGGAVADGIMGGDIDAILIGASLNSNSTVYEVLVIPGDTVAGNAGWSIAGTFMPVSPDPPPDAPFDPDSPQEPPDPPFFDPPFPPPTIPDPLPPAGPMPGLADDLLLACEPDTRRMINVALSRIGINKQIGNVATDQTAEAVAVRLIYKDAIETTLRDFPWPFATRYAQLTQVSVTRPNSDWLYAYRQPNDCLFERRLVLSRTDVANPDTIPFQLSTDFDPGVDEDLVAVPPVVGVPATGGGLIFCNLANAVLEYTARPKCPHTKGEPLFRDAAAWKMAEMMAPSLSRMTDATVLCAKAYSATLEQAYVVLRPGNAGEVPAATTVDTTAAAQAANLSVANAALIQIGARTIRNLTSDQTREAQLVRMVFEQELRATLRDYPWPFATVYVTPALVGGTSTVPVNDDWQYSYRLPTDVVFARRLVTQSRRTYDANPATFKLAHDATGGLLYTDTEDAVLEYTNRPDRAVLVADPLFRDALAWRLSWKLAPSLAMLVPDRPEAVGRGPDESAQATKERTATGTSLRARAADKARECYYFALATAKVGAAREQQPDPTPQDAAWISERN